MQSPDDAAFRGLVDNSEDPGIATSTCDKAIRPRLASSVSSSSSLSATQQYANVAEIVMSASNKYDSSQVGFIKYKTFSIHHITTYWVHKLLSLGITFAKLWAVVFFCETLRLKLKEFRWSFKRGIVKYCGSRGLNRAIFHSILFTGTAASLWREQPVEADKKRTLKWRTWYSIESNQFSGCFTKVTVSMLGQPGRDGVEGVYEISR